MSENTSEISTELTAPEGAEPVIKEPKFIHLRLHTDFSMCDGLNKVKPIVARAADLGMPALAITDQTNLCGLVKY